MLYSKQFFDPNTNNTIDRDPNFVKQPNQGNDYDQCDATSFSSGEEDFPLSLSEWLKRRRQELDLTQDQLAQRASCSAFAIRKMESGERRPSRQLAEFLAKALEIPAENQRTFIQVAPGGEVSNACMPSFPVALPCRPENPDQPPETCRGR